MKISRENGELVIRISAEQITRLLKEEGVAIDELPLTRRQRDVFNLARQRLTNKEIAGRLNLSESSARSHMSEIFRRLAIESRAEFWFKFGFQSV